MRMRTKYNIFNLHDCNYFQIPVRMPDTCLQESCACVSSSTCSVNCILMLFVLAVDGLVPYFINCVWLCKVELVFFMNNSLYLSKQAIRLRTPKQSPPWINLILNNCFHGF